MKKSARILVLPALVSLVTAGVSPVPRACDAVCRVLSDPIRRLLSFLSSLVPFPLFEVALPVLFFAFVFAVVRAARGGDLSVLSRRTAAFAGVVFSLFLLLSVLPARRTPPPDPTPPSDADLSAFAAWLSGEANAAEAVLPASQGRGTPPAFPSASDLSSAVSDALRGTGLCPIPPTRVKVSLFPGVLSRLGILGYHTPLSGEAVIDPGAPAYTVPFTAAHEAAHQAGILSEGEASYAAYVALISSPDPALRYAGATGALDAVLPHLSARTRRELLSSLSPRVREDLSLFDEALGAGDHAGVVAGENRAAIRLRGGEEPRSYDLFPILACRRFRLGAAGDADAPSAIY